MSSTARASRLSRRTGSSASARPRRRSRPSPRSARAAASPATAAGTSSTAEEVHGGGEHDRADDRRVDQQCDGDAESHLLEHDQLAACEAGEHGDDDQRRARDDSRGRGDAEDDGLRGRVASSERLAPKLVVAFLDPAEQEDLVVHREPEQHGEEEERHPRLDRVDLVEPEDAGGDTVLEDEHEQPVRGPDRQQVEEYRSRGDHQRAEDDRQEDERQPEHERDHPRRRADHGVEIVDVLRRRASDEHLGVGLLERAWDDVRPQVAHGGDARDPRRDRREPAPRARRRFRPASESRFRPRSGDPTPAASGAAQGLSAWTARRWRGRRRSPRGWWSPAGSRAGALRSP